MRTSIRTTSGASSIAPLDRRAPVGRLAHDLDRLVAREHRARPARIRSSSSTSSTRTGVTGAPAPRRGTGSRARTRKRPSRSAGVEPAAEQGRALAHADEAVPVRADGRRRRTGLVTVSSSSSARERDLDVGAARAVAGRVRQRLLQDPVGGPVDARRERSAARRDRRPRRRDPMRGGARRGRRAPRGRAGGSTAVSTEPSSRSARTSWSISPTVSRATSSIVSSAALGARRILFLQQAGGAGLDEDHVDRVTGGVVEVAGDARSFLGRREPALALRLPLGAQGTLLQLGDPASALAEPVTDHPRATPDERASQERHEWERVVGDARSGDMQGVEAGDRAGGEERASAGRGRMEAEEEERDGRSERRTLRIVERREGNGRCGGDREHGEWRAPPGHERQRAERGQRDPERIQAAGVRVGVPRTPCAEDREREAEHACGDPGVGEKLPAAHVSRVTALEKRRLSPREDPPPTLGGGGTSLRGAAELPPPGCRRRRGALLAWQADDRRS